MDGDEVTEVGVMSVKNRDYSFEDVPKRVMARLRPGIIEAVDNYSNDTFKVDHINSRYKGQRIGSNMEALVDSGMAEILDEDRTGNFDYTVTADDLDPAKDKAEDAFRYMIITRLDDFREDSVLVTNDLQDKGLKEAYNEEALAHFRKDDYHPETLEFLSELSMIESSDDRIFTADQRDLDYLVDHNDEWMEISESLSENDRIPKEYFLEKAKFP